VEREEKEEKEEKEAKGTKGVAEQAMMGGTTREAGIAQRLQEPCTPIKTLISHHKREKERQHSARGNHHLRLDYSKNSA